MVLLQLIGVLVIYTGIFALLAIVLRVFSKWKTTSVIGTALVGSAAIMLLIFIFGCIFAFIFNPVKPDRSEIIGHYEIDRSRYPGKQANWQHATYSLEITSTQVIVRDTRTKTTWKSAIEWYYQPEYRWKFADSTNRHHIISEGPAIYRESFGYYYVFRSPLYGDMFFLKK
ncbi:MAG: hypothetical protein ACSHX9_02750 [Luteolibacter sp.]